MGQLSLKLFDKVEAAYYFLCSKIAHVHACSPSYTDEEWKKLWSIPKQCVFGLLIIVLINL